VIAPAPTGAVLAAIQAAAAKTGVPLALAEAIAYTESGYNPNAIGDSGQSVGLYQLNSSGEGAGMTVVAREDPYQNALIALSRVGSIYKAQPGADWGSIAAQAQRPADPAAYAGLVDFALTGQGTQAPLAAAAGAVAGAAGAGLTGIGHGLADWIISLGKSIGGFFSNNLVGVVVAGIGLYIVFAPDVAGTSRV
jgi:hypothetical protein